MTTSTHEEEKLYRVADVEAVGAAEESLMDVKTFVTMIDATRTYDTKNETYHLKGDEYLLLCHLVDTALDKNREAGWQSLYVHPDGKVRGPKSILGDGWAHNLTHCANMRDIYDTFHLAYDKAKALAINLTETLYGDKETLAHMMEDHLDVMNKAMEAVFEKTKTSDETGFMQAA